MSTPIPDLLDRIPGHLVDAAHEIEHWFRSNGVTQWKLFGIQSRERGWFDVNCELPECHKPGEPKPYVLVTDAIGRMSVAYRREHSAPGYVWWVMAKPIGVVTYWMALPEPPIKGDF